MEILEYLAIDGRSPFRTWFDGLDATAAAKVTVAIERMKLGNLAGSKGVGGGVLEHRLDFGPGYRIYFGKDGTSLVILLAGGTKQRQQTNIQTARARWADYKQRKKGAR